MFRHAPGVTARVLAAVLALAGAVTLAGCGGRSGGAGTGDTTVLEYAVADRVPAPGFTGDLLEGGRYDVAQDRGSVVVVNFWGSWCPPCRAEVDDLEETYQATKAQGVRFLGIDVRDDRDKALAFHRGRVSYPSLFDPASRLALKFEVPPNTIPATIIIDRAGRIAVVIRKAVRRVDLEPIVARIAAESATGGQG